MRYDFKKFKVNDKLFDLYSSEFIRAFTFGGQHHYIDIKLNHGLLNIQNRAPYCDRGKYSVKCFSNNPIDFYIDDADMFPRYYFKFRNLLSEMECFIMERKLEIISCELKILELKLKND